MASGSPSENGSAPGSVTAPRQPARHRSPASSRYPRVAARRVAPVARRGEGRRRCSRTRRQDRQKHRPEAADRHIKAGGVEAMHLGVAELVPNVVEPFGRRQLTGALKHRLRHVDADNAARSRGPRRLTSRQPGSAADINHFVTRADPVCGTKVLVVSAQLGVVKVQAFGEDTHADAMDYGSARPITSSRWRRPHQRPRRTRRG